MWIGPPNPPFKYSSSAFHFVMPLKFYNYHLGVILEIGYVFIFSSSCMYNFTLCVKFIFGALFIVIQVISFYFFLVVYINCISVGFWWSRVHS